MLYKAIESDSAVLGLLEIVPESVEYKPIESDSAVVL